MNDQIENYELDMNNIPAHIAFIMDGNGRWAKKRMMPRTYGHNEGTKTIRKIALEANRLGVKAMTVYAFSTENFSRPEEEVQFIFKLPKKFFELYLKELIENNVQICMIGHLEKAPKATRDIINAAIERTKDNTGLKLCFAFIYGSRDEIVCSTKKIAQDVKENKDEACLKYTQQFDKVSLDTMEVSQEEWDAQILKCDDSFVEAMKLAKKNIEDFHKLQKQNGYLLQKEKGIYLGQRVLPLEAVGIYVPGGRAQYPSSVLMNALPAKIAGVQNVVMVTPPDKNGTIHPNIAYAAKLAGVDKIYKIGGAQAIAALAYGTQTIDRVDKIVGPGNIYVAAAKKLVYGTVDIDMIAGPSEILVVADEKANAEYVAADLLSQAEHDPMASAILLTTNEELLDLVNQELLKQSAVLPKKDIVEQSLKNYGKAIVCDSIEECISISNEIAPEHLELMIQNPMEHLQEVKNAGSVFLGYYTCESIGDYFGGTNHVLPTSGTARFSSALSVDSFIKKSSYLYYSKQAIEAYGKYIETIASEEHLQAHANAAKVRMK